MSETTIGLIAVGVVFSLNVVLLSALVVLKAVHRTRVERHERRHTKYLAVLSRRLATEDHTDQITPAVAEDDAFLDAVIDLRNIVSGSEIETLNGIVDGVGLARRQEERLRQRFPLGRRLRAAVSLAEMGDASNARALIDHLDDREPEIRIQCARGLGRMRYTAAIDPILERLAIEEPWVRSRLADTLVGFGTRATWPLLSYIRVNIDHDDNEGVIEAIRILGMIGDQEAGPPLAWLLPQVGDVEARLATIDALGSVGSPLAIRPLVQAFHSEDWRLRAKSAAALARIGDPSVNETLSSGLRDVNWWVRRNSAAGLAVLPGGRDHLYRALVASDRFGRDAAAEALADCGALAEARDRADQGAPTDQDRVLLDYVAGAEAVPA
jgi:HEAT repeat protein